MLILTVKQNKSVLFTVDRPTVISPDDEINITLLSVQKNGSYKVGIQAPKNIKILRENLKKYDSTKDPILKCVNDK